MVRLLCRKHILNSDYLAINFQRIYCGACSFLTVLPIRIRDPVPFWSLIPNPYFESLVTIFWVKSSIILWKLAQIIFLQHFKNKIVLILWNLWRQKKGIQQFLFHPCLSMLFLDPGTEIWDPGWEKTGSGIRDKHSGSATLLFDICIFYFYIYICAYHLPITYCIQKHKS
jgi:hypothetical protein